LPFKTGATLRTGVTSETVGVRYVPRNLLKRKAVGINAFGCLSIKALYSGTCWDIEPCENW